MYELFVLVTHNSSLVRGEVSQNYNTMFGRFYVLFALLLLCGIDEAFRHRVSFRSRGRLLQSSQREQESKAYLDEGSLWRLNFKLVKEGQKDIDFYLRVRFIEQRGYEPPQGKIFVEDDTRGVVKVDDNGYSGIWTLSEDKDDRKDGLWIWGNFFSSQSPMIFIHIVLLFLDDLPQVYSRSLSIHIYISTWISITQQYFHLEKKNPYLEEMGYQEINCICAAVIIETKKGVSFCRMLR